MRIKAGKSILEGLYTKAESYVAPEDDALHLVKV
jgi:hypothetical protein